MWCIKKYKCHCVKNACIRSYSGPQFPAFGLKKERYDGVSLYIQSKCGKMQTRITPNTDTFHAVCTFSRFLFSQKKFIIDAWQGPEFTSVQYFFLSDFAENVASIWTRMSHPLSRYFAQNQWKSVCKFQIILQGQRRIQNPVKHLRWRFFTRIVKVVNYFRKKLQLRCLTRF